jgi:hypothetical protein
MRGEDILAHGRKEKRRSEKELRREERKKRDIGVMYTREEEEEAHLL